MEEQTIRTLLLTFIGTLKTKDKALMQSHLLQSFTAKLIRNGTILHLTSPQEFLDRLPWDSPQDLEEVLTSIDIKVYEDIAVAWAPFHTTVDGVVGSMGTNIITLVKVTPEGRGAGSKVGTWKISGVFDTSMSFAGEVAVKRE